MVCALGKQKEPRQPRPRPADRTLNARRPARGTDPPTAAAPPDPALAPAVLDQTRLQEHSDINEVSLIDTRERSRLGPTRRPRRARMLQVAERPTSDPDALHCLIAPSAAPCAPPMRRSCPSPFPNRPAPARPPARCGKCPIEAPSAPARRKSHAPCGGVTPVCFRLHPARASLEAPQPGDSPNGAPW